MSSLSFPLPSSLAGQPSGPALPVPTPCLSPCMVASTKSWTAMSEITSKFLVLKFGEHLGLHFPDATADFMMLLVSILPVSILPLSLSSQGPNIIRAFLQKSPILPGHYNEQGIENFVPNCHLSCWVCFFFFYQFPFRVLLLFVPPETPQLD